MATHTALPSTLAAGTLARSSVAAAGRAAAAIAGVDAPSIDAEAVAVAYTSERWLRVGGAAPGGFAPLSAFFRTADGWVRTHANYPHHARALRTALAVDGDADADMVAARLGALDSSAAVARITSAGGLCVAVARENPELDAGLRRAPLVSTTRTDAAPRPRLDRSPDTPLRGIRVLDLTRVIAGPVATRTLALWGADVLRIDPPHVPEIAAQHLDTGHGKRSALLDLRRTDDRARFHELVASADVAALGYRPSGLDRLGVTATALARRRPGIVIGRLSAWGEPDRRGFDSLVQAACGIAWIESADGETPGALPAQALDHSAGYLLAAGIVAALRRRATEGGSWVVETSLRRVAAELLGMPRAIERSAEWDGALGEIHDLDRHLQSFDVDGAHLVTAAPAIPWGPHGGAYAPPRPWGEDPPEWLPR